MNWRGYYVLFGFCVVKWVILGDWVWEIFWWVIFLLVGKDINIVVIVLFLDDVGYGK